MRDHRGVFIAATTGSIGWTCSAFHAELFAARQAVLLAQTFCHVGKRMIFESDSSLVLVAMKGQEEDCSFLGPVINDLHFLLQSFPQSLVNYVQRGGNSAAHRLARVGVVSNQQLLWFEDPLDLLRDTLFEESL
ncbi:hypothetical protein ACFX2J_042343 [Malus domestica]